MGLNTGPSTPKGLTQGLQRDPSWCLKIEFLRKSIFRHQEGFF